jgi:serine protease AprX
LRFGPNDELRIAASLWTANYVFGKLSPDTISRLPNSMAQGPKGSQPLIYKIWLDQNIERCVFESVRTVKCDAAKAAFAASGRGIVWAIADTGIDCEHPHFQTLATLTLPDGLSHADFTGAQPDASGRNAALIDTDGHGTHVAGIIAGMTRTKKVAPEDPHAVTKITIQTNVRETSTSVKTTDFDSVDMLCGMAPECKLMSLKVLQSGKGGGYSNLLAAIGYIQKVNEYGRNLRVHGLNISLGFLFDPENFAAGQSPLCVEVDHLVRSGVCVVIAAGNGGYGNVSVYSGGTERSANLGTIADPGNAALAITVGSTHRDMPHAYGVSYFSAKGPTADGRMKPDLVAPGERIVSCALVNQAIAAAGNPPNDHSAASDMGGSNREAMFRTDNGTSMAAPHVSGAIAAFLSVRGEFKGRPEQVKEIFVRSATDLNRRAEFQGAGLLDAMRALQTV